MAERLFVDPNIARAKTLSKDFYISKDLFDETREKLFASSWQYVGYADMLKDANTAYPITLLKHFLDEPLLLTSDKDHSLHLLSNVCTHRGNIIVDEPCTVNNLRCKYHGRQFHHDGRFLSMPEFKEVEQFPSPEDDLKRLTLFQWGKWLFTSLNNKHQPESFLNDMMNRLSWLPLNDFVFRADLSREYIVKAHWALYTENYLEGFHIPFVHPGLNEKIDFGNYTTELFRYSNLQTGIAKAGEDAFILPQSSPDYGKNVAAYYFWIFPNTMYNFYPWGVSVNVVNPLGIDKSKISFLVFVLDESKLNIGAGSNLNSVELEDEAVVEKVQRGIRSRFYDHGRYSVTREQGIHHFHRLICEFMGKGNLGNKGIRE